ncbi:MAG: glycosyltransferase family 9 protein [Nanoarchaeota archaeon]|nr:glycosyltransferase family 9 protein [Nanoarchaeota archaeon]
MDNELKKKIDAHLGNMLINSMGLLLKSGPQSKDKALKNPKKILLIKFWGIGNLIMLTPLIKAIREKFPKSQISFLTLSKNKGLFENLEYIDEVIYYDLGAMDTARIINLTLKYYEKFDVAIDFEQFLNISSIIAHFLGKYSIGFSNKTRSRHKMYNHSIPLKTNIHAVEQFYDLCKVLDIKSKSIKFENFDSIKKSDNVDSLFRKIGMTKKTKKPFLIGIHIGSSENAEVKRWPKRHFVELINILNKKLDNLAFVMTGIESEKHDMGAIIGKIEKKNVYNSCGIFDLKDLIYLLKKCDLFISNDTGPIHLAAAFGVKCVGLYGPTSPTLYGPYGKNHIIFYEKTRCSPCVNNYNSKSSDCKDAICMKKIRPNKVANVIIDSIKN